MENIINSVDNDAKYLSNVQNLEYTKSLNYKLPFLKKLDFRLGFNGNIAGDSLNGGLINDDYYAMNFSFNNFNEMRKQKAIKTAQIKSFDAENNLLLHQLKLERYQSLAVIFYSQKLFDERSKLYDFLDKKQKSLYLSIEQGLDIKFKDVMDTEADKNLLSTVLLEYQNSLDLNREKIKQFLKIKEKNVLNIDFQDFINVNSIEKNVKNLKADTFLVHPILWLKNKQTQFSKSEYEYQNAQNHQILSFFQLGYQSSVYGPQFAKKFNPSNDIAFRVGLNVPLPNNNSLKIAKSALQQKTDEQDELLSKIILTKNIDLQYVKLENLIKNYRLNEKNKSESLIIKMLENQKLLSQLSALEILDLKIAQFKLEIRSLEISSEITNEYLRFLEMTGAWYKDKNKNFLKN